MFKTYDEDDDLIILDGVWLPVGKNFFLFMKSLDGNGFLEQDEGGWICVIKRKDE